MILVDVVDRWQQYWRHVVSGPPTMLLKWHTWTVHDGRCAVCIHAVQCLSVHGTCRRTCRASYIIARIHNQRRRRTPIKRLVLLVPTITIHPQLRIPKSNSLLHCCHVRHCVHISSNPLYFSYSYVPLCVYKLIRLLICLLAPASTRSDSSPLPDAGSLFSFSPSMIPSLFHSTANAYLFRKSF